MLKLLIGDGNISLQELKLIKEVKGVEAAASWLKAHEVTLGEAVYLLANKRSPLNMLP